MKLFEKQSKGYKGEETTKNMYKPENQQLFCSMDQGATETDLIPNKQQQNILNPTNLLKFVVNIM